MKRRTTIRRHLRWAIPLALGLVSLGAVGFASSSTVGADDTNNALASLGLTLCAILALLIASTFFLVGAIRTLAEWRRARRHAAGRFTAVERAKLAWADQFAAGWESARRLRSALIRREIPEQIQVWDVVPNAGEAFFADGAASYARYYGQDVPYTQTGSFFFGHPLFVAAGISLSAATNAARRSNAEAAAHAQWREHQTVRLLVSNQRLMCNVNGQWLSFYYDAIAAVYPEIRQWTLVCQFHSTSPLLLHGASAPTAALIAVLMSHGHHAVEHHPSLLPLSE